MRTVVTRIDDDLHRRLRERAAAEGVSMNSLVRDAIVQLVEADDPRAALRRRLDAAGRLAQPPTPDREPPSREEALALSRGLGPFVDEALDWARGPR